MPGLLPASARRRPGLSPASAGRAPALGPACFRVFWLPPENRPNRHAGSVTAEKAVVQGEETGPRGVADGAELAGGAVVGERDGHFADHRPAPGEADQ